MKKALKLSIIILIPVIIITLFLVIFLNKGNQDSVSTVKYTSSDLGEVRIYQQSSIKYNMEIELPENVVLDSKSPEIYLSQNETFRENNADMIDFALEENVCKIDSIELLPGDYFLWFINGEEQISTIITIPKMSPKIWMNGLIPNIEFELDGNTSWSSFVDPEGKNIYRSKSSKFDDSAVALRANMNILESSFNDSNPTEDEPYYYIVMTGKNGKQKFVTSPLFYHATQSKINAVFKIEKNEPLLYLSGNVYAINKDAEKNLELRVGNFDPNNSKSTFIVENSYTGSDNSSFIFKIPVSQLRDTVNNLVIFLDENGTMLEWSIDAKSLDLSNQSIVCGDITYSLADNAALKIKKIENIFDKLNSKLAVLSDNKAQLSITGKYKQNKITGKSSLVIKSSAGESYISANTSKDPDCFDFKFNINQLKLTDTWYDIEIISEETRKHYPLPYSSADPLNSVKLDNFSYGFQCYEELLKLEKTEEKDFENVSVNLIEKSKKPFLHISGNTSFDENDNVYLAIRSGDSIIKSENLSDKKDTFDFEFDLSTLTKLDTWYDVLIGVSSSNKLYDVKTIYVSDMNQVIINANMEYSLREYDGDLKINKSDCSPVLENIKAELTGEDEKGYLNITGNLIGDTLGDNLSLALRTGDTILSTNNISADKNKAVFKFNLGQIELTDTWYDVLIYNKEQQKYIDVKKDSAINYDTPLTIGYNEYQFKEYDGDLKINYSDCSPALENLKAELTEEDEKGYLNITGNLIGDTLGDDLSLALRTSDIILSTDNISTDKEKAVFKFNLGQIELTDTWYDVLVFNKKQQKYIDVKKDSAINYDTPLTIGYNDYQFKEYNGDLKVTRSDKTPICNNISVDFSDKGDKPYLVVTGDLLDSESYDSVNLIIRTNDEVKKSANISTDKNKAKFVFNMSTLNKKDTWYDVLIQDTSTGRLVDLHKDEALDYNNRIRCGGRIYSFKDWEDDLKINYEYPPTSAPRINTTILSTSSFKADIVNTGSNSNLVVTADAKDFISNKVYLKIRTDAQTVNVENSSTDPEKLVFKYNMSELTQANTWYDLGICTSSSSVFTDLRTSAVDDMDKTIQNTKDEREYSFKEWSNYLKINFASTVQPATSIVADIVNDGEVSNLVVTADVKGYQSDDVYLKIRTDAQTIDVQNTSSTDGKLLFKYDMSALTQADTWYDLGLCIKDIDGFTDLTTSAVDDMAKTIQNDTNEREYSFKEWSGYLKINFTSITQQVSSIVADIINEDTVSKLVVTADTVGYASDDVYLKIRSGSQTVDVQNTSSTDGKVSFEYDMSALTEFDTWYDLGICIKDVDGFTDLTTSAVDDMAKTIQNATDERQYSFQQWDDCLKINFTSTAKSVTSIVADIINEDTVSKLVVTADTLGYASDDVYLKIRSDTQTIDIQNTSSTDGKVSFEYDMSALTQADTWYDLGICIKEVDGFTDLTTSAVDDMAKTIQNATKDREYSFQEWSEYLKINFTII